jgi:hypothetical protein
MPNIGRFLPRLGPPAPARGPFFLSPVRLVHLCAFGCGPQSKIRTDDIDSACADLNFRSKNANMPWVRPCHFQDTTLPSTPT